MVAPHTLSSHQASLSTCRTVEVVVRQLATLKLLSESPSRV